MPRRRQQGISVFDDVDAWLDRLQIVDEGDDEVAKFLDTLDLHGPQEREMLAELARNGTIARPDELLDAHRRAVASLETLGRHGYRSAVLPRWARPKPVFRFFVELVARYVVVSHIKNVVVQLRNLYWLREMEAPRDSRELDLLHTARTDAQALVDITKSREIGVPTFVIGGLLIPASISLWRLASGTVRAWWVALVVGAIGVAIGLTISWLVLRGAALASRRIRLSVTQPLAELWRTIGNCGQPPKDQSDRFAVVAISLTLGVWIVLPLLVTLSLAR